MIIIVDSQKRGIPWLYTDCFGTGLGAMSQWTSKETLQHQSPVETFPFRNEGKTKVGRLTIKSIIEADMPVYFLGGRKE